MEEKLPAALLERILQKLALTTYPESDENGLRAVYSAWCHKVPFDNVRKLIHINEGNSAPLPGDTATDFFENWLIHGTGGTCWSTSGALFALLHSLGFEASRGLATMLVGPNLPPNHGTVFVDCDEQKLLVDTSIRTLVPLLIVDDCDSHVYPNNVKLTKRDGQYYIWWRPLNMLDGLECRIETFAASAQDYQQRHEQTREWSPFNYELASRLNNADGTFGTSAGKWVELGAQGQVFQEEINDHQRRILLVERLGMSQEIVEKLPPDRPTPPPPWSKTAQASAQS